MMDFNPISPNLDLDTLTLTRKGNLSYIDKNINTRCREEYFHDQRYWLPEGVSKITNTSVNARLIRTDGTKFSKSFSASKHKDMLYPMRKAIIEATQAVLAVKATSSLSMSKTIIPRFIVDFGKERHQTPIIKIDCTHYVDKVRYDHGSHVCAITNFSFTHFLELFSQGHESMMTTLALSKAEGQIDGFAESNTLHPNDLMWKYAEAVDKALKRLEAKLFEDFPDNAYPTLDEASEASGIGYKETDDYIQLNAFRSFNSKVLQLDEYQGFESYDFARRIATVTLWVGQDTPEPNSVGKPIKVTNRPHPTSGVIGVSVATDERRKSLIIQAYTRYKGKGRGHETQRFYVSKYGLKEAFRKAVSVSRRYFLEDELSDKAFDDLYLKFRGHILPRLPNEYIKTVAKELDGITVVAPQNPTMIGARRVVKSKRTNRKSRCSK
ncbi:hypothetical protein VCHA53O466_140061 [Vibrio chagasii]|nr:hypothetical protein VCHA53O466_140061 [Vibrio chagasii]